MKATELMIGDWVRRRWTCSDTGREVVKDSQVTEIRKNGETLYAWSKNGNIGRVENLEPIPLTTEILEKNGFINSVDVALFDRETGRIESDFVCAAKLEYIHELQHALRLCGIEREIKL